MGRSMDSYSGQGAATTSPVQLAARRWAPAQYGAYLAPLLVLAAGLVLPQFIPGRYMDALVLFVIYAYISTCWNLVGGLAGKLCLAHGAFFGLGGYASAVLFVDYGVPVPLGAALGAVISGAIAWLISGIAFTRRIGALYFALLTLAFGSVTFEFVHQWEVNYKLLGIHIPLRDEPLNLLFLDKTRYYYTGLVMLVLALIAWRWVISHRFGYFLQAAREDERAAMVLGINVPRVLTLATVTSAVLTSFAGMLAATYFLSVEANFMLSFDWIMAILVATILGGIGRQFGPVLGAAFVVMLGEFVRSLPAGAANVDGLTTMLYGAVLVLVVSVAPGGLLDLIHRWVLLWKRKAFAQRG